MTDFLPQAFNDSDPADDDMPVSPAKTALTHIALIGNALPRRCGLATFTSDTLAGLNAAFPDLAVDIYAMDDDSGVAYPAGIRTIAADDPAAHREAAAEIEASGAQAIWLQHEYGIFGGSAGEHILRLLERTTLSLVVTLHTVLEAPDADQRRVLGALVARADWLIVMAEQGRAILQRVYGVDPAMISVIPHGVPDRPLIETSVAKAKLGLSDRPMILTFGLLAPDKGIEHMIAAMPAVMRARPDADYVVLGATHPNLKREAGEAYREKLMADAAALGVADHVRFIDAFVEQDELLDWLGAADIYVTPYRKRDQITSGTLSYAVGLGKPVIATPYIHATEILADGVGRLVDFDDSEAMAAEIIALLNDQTARLAIARRAYARGRTMTWAQSSRRAVALLGESVIARQRPLSRIARDRLLPVETTALLRMTDGTGMLQHAIHSVPDRRHGYCIDDNVRALMLTNRLNRIDPQLRERLSATYAAFIQHGWNPGQRRFRNFMSYERVWLEQAGSEDSNGRTLWALGLTAVEAPSAALRRWATGLFAEAAPLAFDLSSPRAMAFAMLGSAAMLSAHPRHALARDISTRLGEALLHFAAEQHRPDWAWFEAVLAYDNARLPEAMIRAGMALGRDDFSQCGLATLRWINDQQTAAEGHYRPVGTDSFGREHVRPRRFDQQPLEAQATIDACSAAWMATGDTAWIDAARTAYRWYLGANDLNLPLASAEDGGCHDGLMPHGLNRNQGAESILALHLATTAMARLPMTGEEEAKSGLAA